MQQARVYLDEGELFGPEGEGFEVTPQILA